MISSRKLVVMVKSYKMVYNLIRKVTSVILAGGS